MKKGITYLLFLLLLSFTLKAGLLTDEGLLCPTRLLYNPEFGDNKLFLKVSGGVFCYTLDAQNNFQFASILNFPFIDQWSPIALSQNSVLYALENDTISGWDYSDAESPSIKYSIIDIGSNDIFIKNNLLFSVHEKYVQVFKLWDNRKPTPSQQLSISYVQFIEENEGEIFFVRPNGFAVYKKSDTGLLIIRDFEEFEVEMPENVKDIWFCNGYLIYTSPVYFDWMEGNSKMVFYKKDSDGNYKYSHSFTDSSLCPVWEPVTIIDISSTSNRLLVGDLYSGLHSYTVDSNMQILSDTVIDCTTCQCRLENLGDSSFISIGPSGGIKVFELNSSGLPNYISEMRNTVLSAQSFMFDSLMYAVDLFGKVNVYDNTKYLYSIMTNDNHVTCSSLLKDDFLYLFQNFYYQVYYIKDRTSPLLIQNVRDDYLEYPYNGPIVTDNIIVSTNFMGWWGANIFSISNDRTLKKHYSTREIEWPLAKIDTLILTSNGKLYKVDTLSVEQIDYDYPIHSFNCALQQDSLMWVQYYDSISVWNVSDIFAPIFMYSIKPLNGIINFSIYGNTLYIMSFASNSLDIDVYDLPITSGNVLPNGGISLPNSIGYSPSSICAVNDGCYINYFGLRFFKYDKEAGILEKIDPDRSCYLSIRPVCTDSKLMMRSTLTSGIVNYVIYDVCGKVVNRNSIKIINNQADVEISFLKSGIYFVNASFKGKTESFKFMKID